MLQHKAERTREVAAARERARTEKAGYEALLKARSKEKRDSEAAAKARRSSRKSSAKLEVAKA